MKKLFFKLRNLIKKNFVNIHSPFKIRDNNHFYPLVFTLVFVLVLLQYSFYTFEASFYDVWAKYDFLSKPQREFVVVYMDETTDQFLGEVYPYSYATHVKMLKSIAEDNPFSIIYFVDFKDPANEEEEKHFGRFQENLNNYIEKIPLRFATSMDLLGELLPPERLQKFGYSLGLINEDSEDFSKDGVSRKAIINVSGEDTLHFWLANIIRKNQGEVPLDTKSLRGSFYDAQADASFAFFRYTFSASNSPLMTKIPLQRVVGKNLPKGYFKDKIVLLGHQYVSRPDDFVYTPFNRNDKMPKLNVHASIIEALAQEKTLIHVPNWLTNILSILIAFILSIMISRVNPSKGLKLIGSVAFGIIVLAYLLFIIFGFWMHVSHMALSVFLVYYIWVPFRAIAEYQTRFAIQEETKLIKKVDHLKQNFISLMSHDLKTPVAKISGIAESILLKLPPDSLTIKKLVFNLMDATNDLNGFITSILDLTKIESENIKLNLVSKDINSIVEGTIFKLNELAEVRKIILETQLSPLYPIMIDPLLITRVISNLIENAIKYAGDGCQVLVKSWDDPEWVYIEIIDNGIGIDLNDREHIFDKFYRVKNDASHSIKGTGLGLYLVKYFVELHHGKVNLESEIGKGTKFTLQFINK